MRHNKKTLWVIFFIGLFVFAYIAIRANVLSFTYDESVSYLEFVRKDFSLNNMHGDAANNHLLNTWLMKIVSTLLGDSEFSLRLPNVLAYLLYAFYSAKIVLHFRKPLMVICAFILLNINPFLLDFFSLARGYGLSIGCMMGSLYFLFRFIRNHEYVLHAFISILFAAISVLANFTLMNHLFALLAVIISVLFFYSYKEETSKRNNFLIAKNILIVLIIPVLLLYYIVPIFFLLRSANALFFGGNQGFLENTLESSVVVFLYDSQNYFLTPVLKFFVITVIFVSIFFFLYDIKNNRSFNFLFFSILILIIIVSLSTIVQHFIFSTPFLIERTALLFFPLFSLLLVFLIERLSCMKAGFIWIAPFIAFLLCVHFSHSMNFSYVQQWKNNADVKKAISFLKKNKMNMPSDIENLTIGADFDFVPCINYYRASQQLYWLNAAFNESLLPTQNYFLTSDTIKFESILKNALSLSRFESGVALYENKQKALYRRTLFHQKEDFEHPPIPEIQYFHISDIVGDNSQHSSRTDSNNVFSDALTFSFPDSISEMKIIATCKAKVYAPAIHFDAALVFQLDSLDKAVLWKTVNIHDYVHRPKQWDSIFFTAQLPHTVVKGQFFKVYLLNLGSEEVYIDNMELKIIGYTF